MMKPTTKAKPSNHKAKAAKYHNYQEQDNQHSELLSWNENGTAIVIKKPSEFAEKVLPIYFKHSNFASFIRQLNMYKFKKKRNYQYDYLYVHEMFRRGKIDLLRNIQRKPIEDASMLSEQQKSQREDFEVDIDNIIQENLHYKQIHKTLSTQVKFIQDKMKDLKDEVVLIQQQQKQHQSNTEFLKKVVKSLTKVYGYETIARVVEAIDDDEEIQRAPPVNNQEFRSQRQCNEYSARPESINTHRPLKSQLPFNKPDEDVRPAKNLSNTTEYRSAESTPPSYEEYAYNPNDHSRRDDMLQDPSFRNALSGFEGEQQMDTGNPYKSLFLEFEKMKSNPDLFLGQLGNYPMGDFDIEDPYRYKNKMVRGSEY